VVCVVLESENAQDCYCNPLARLQLKKKSAPSNSWLLLPLAMGRRMEGGREQKKEKEGESITRCQSRPLLAGRAGPGPCSSYSLLHTATRIFRT
jgi:hypothetical protein